MFLNIITPCSRPNNLFLIEQSINIPRENYRWIVVFDADSLPSPNLIPSSCEPYCIKDTNSICGNAQRNYALSIIKDGYVYFNDDDTIIHPKLWENIKDLNTDFISFSQLRTDGFLRLIGDCIQVGSIDSHNFIVNKSIVGNDLWISERHEADGLFAINCYQKAKTFTFINKPLSVYNYLRPGTY